VFVAAQAQHLFPALRKVDLTGREIPIPEAVVRPARGTNVARLALPQRFLRATALGHVADAGAEHFPRTE
jgi:hypothetical protein